MNTRLQITPVNDAAKDFGSSVSTIDMGGTPDGVLPGMAATMEVAGLESVEGLHAGPMMIGYSMEDK